MIPVKLQLKNFLSYGADIQTIDFSPYPLICLSGKNGHGKSALLDALTWAIWGQARKTMSTSKADQGLVRLGQTQMMVCLDFIFNNNLYRVKREFAITYGKPYALLEFGIFDTKLDAFIPLTDKTIRATQDKIISLLNLDFDAFVNSAFLRQGQANEFSKKSPKDRKEIFARILGLDHYEAIRKRASEKVKIAQTTEYNLVTFQEKMAQELANKDALAEQLSQAHTAIKETTQHLAQLDHQQELLDKDQHALVQRRHEQQLLIYQRDQVIAHEHEMQPQLRNIIAQWRAIHKKQRSLPDYNQVYTRKEQITQHLEQYNTLRQQLLDIKEQYLQKKELLTALEHTIYEAHTKRVHAITVALERLHVTSQNNQKRLQELHTLCLNHTQELTACITAQSNRSQKLKDLDVQATHHALLEQQFEKRKQFYQRYSTWHTLLTTEHQALMKKKRFVNTDNSHCPLCQQDLSEHHKESLQTTFTHQARFIEHRLHRIAHLLTRLKALMLEQHAHIAVMHKEKEQRQQIQAEFHEATKTHATLMTAHAANKAQITLLEQQMQIVEKESTTHKEALVQAQQEQVHLLQNHAEYQNLAAQLKMLEAQAKELKYDAKQHTALATQAQELEKIVHEYRQLQEDIHRQEQRKQEVHTLCLALKHLKKNNVEIIQKLQLFAHLDAQEQTLVARKQTIDAQRVQILQTKDLLVHQQGKLETETQKLKQVEQEYKEQEKQLTLLRESIDDYQAIATATSKNGIQALLIEEAIPEVEHEANRLLAKLTNNQTHLFIESLRDLKKGGTKETLDINISDPVGIRPYELFSGGEAFRIDFALRIALAKLLARRAGTSLQTLIIDEGFGSQDEEGLGHIMDALYKIQDDFAKVIIVSHLPSMKDQFPVHFMINKGASGSSISVLEQG